MSATIAAVSNLVGYFKVSMKSFVAGCCLERLDKSVQRRNFSELSDLTETSMEIGEHWKGEPRISFTCVFENGPSILPASTSSLRYSSIKSSLSSTVRLFGQITVFSSSGNSPIENPFFNFGTIFRYLDLSSGN